MTKAMKTVAIISIIILIMAIPPIWPYSYFILLRILICGAGIYAAYKAYQIQKKAWTWIFGIVALLFNPLVPIYLDKETWIFIDVIVAILFCISIFSIKKRTSEHSKMINMNSKISNNPKSIDPPKFTSEVT